ncbi:unnamed protein product, partial [Heterotrigona itama]
REYKQRSLALFRNKVKTNRNKEKKIKPCHMNKHIGRNIAKCDYKNKLILNRKEQLVTAVLIR